MPTDTIPSASDAAIAVGSASFHLGRMLDGPQRRAVVALLQAMAGPPVRDHLEGVLVHAQLHSVATMLSGGMERTPSPTTSAELGSIKAIARSNALAWQDAAERLDLESFTAQERDAYLAAQVRADLLEELDGRLTLGTTSAWRPDWLSTPIPGEDDQGEVGVRRQA